jgi:predicted TIM-barrel fold metal-dependent hydrolase
MPVIDVDSHFEPSESWLDEFPALKRKLPERFPTDDPRFTMRSPEMFAYFVSDIREKYDADRGPEAGYEGADQHQYMVDTGARLRWMDAQGIDMQNVISGVGYTLARAVKDPVVGMESLEAVNTWMSDRAGDTHGRLMTAVNLRFEDLDWAIRELTRMRARGSRTFLLSSEPTGDTPPSHPAYDRFWSAVTDLGMLPIVHVGLSPAIYHPAWANTDNPAVIRVISVLQPYQQAQVFLNAMVLEGVFERHPKLTVLFAEHGIEWITATAFRMDVLASPGVSPLLMGGDYRLPMTPVEYVRRNIRVTPLPVPHESPIGTFEYLPEIPVFSSDYPHFEGNNDPVGHYDSMLAGLTPAVKASFLGENIADCFARMGDPIAAFAA